MGTMININDKVKRRKEKFFLDIQQDSADFLAILTLALQDFTTYPYNWDHNNTLEYKPIFYPGGSFDPYMITYYQITHYFGNILESKPWGPWPECNGLERIRKFWKEECERGLEFYKQWQNNALNLQNVPIDQYFWFTKEALTNNSFILGILAVATGSVKRILIKDVKAVCKLFANFGLFPKVLSKEENAHTIAKPNGMPIKERREAIVKQAMEFMEDATNIEIQDENVSEIISLFIEATTNNGAKSPIKVLETM